MISPTFFRKFEIFEPSKPQSRAYKCLQQLGRGTSPADTSNSVNPIRGRETERDALMRLKISQTSSSEFSSCLTMSRGVKQALGSFPALRPMWDLGWSIWSQSGKILRSPWNQASILTRLIWCAQYEFLSLARTSPQWSQSIDFPSHHFKPSRLLSPATSSMSSHERCKPFPHSHLIANQLTTRTSCAAGRLEGRKWTNKGHRGKPKTKKWVSRAGDDAHEFMLVDWFWYLISGI